MDKAKNRYIGSDFNSFLEEENLVVEAEAVALKRILSWQILQEMKKKKISKTQMASKMRTSRAAVDRLLDPTNTSLTLKNLEKVAHALNKTVKVEFCSAT